MRVGPRDASRTVVRAGTGGDRADRAAPRCFRGRRRRAARRRAERRRWAASLATPIGALDDRPSRAPLVPSHRRRCSIAAATVASRSCGAARARSRGPPTRRATPRRAEGRPDWVVQGGYMLMPGQAGAWTARASGMTWPSRAVGRSSGSASVRPRPTRSRRPRRADLETSRSIADRADGRRSARVARRRARRRLAPRARRHAPAVGSLLVEASAPRIRRRVSCRSRRWWTPAACGSRQKRRSRRPG